MIESASKGVVSKTDCRSEEGITVGLIDSIISLCRILAHRDLECFTVKEALKDLAGDEDVHKILLKPNSHIQTFLEEQQTKLNNVYQALFEKDAIIDQRNKMISEISNEMELTKAHLKACREKIWKMNDVLKD